METWAAGLILFVILAAFVAVAHLSGNLTKAQALHPDEKLLSAYKSQPWWSLGCSFFAAAFGASALVANPEAGASGSWVSAICYGLANGAPYWVMIWIGPKLQSFLKMDGFTVTDFVLKRYGRLMHIFAVLLSLFFLFIWLSAELTSADDAMLIISPKTHRGVASITIGLVTATYALFGKFKASIITDWIQATTAVVLVTMLFIAVLCSVDIGPVEFQAASHFSWSDFSGGIVLILSTCINQFLDLGSWQRIFASENPKQARLGLLAAGSVNFYAQFIMALMGVLAVAAGLSGSITISPDTYFLSFFLLIEQCPKVFAYFTLIFTIILSTSTVDSIENAMTTAFASDLLKRNQSLHWARLGALVLILGAIGLAAGQISVLTLFLVSNIFSACIVPTIFLGLSSRLATPIGAVCGTLVSALSVFIIGWAVEKDFVLGLKWPIFTRGFNHWTTLLSFIIVPIISVGVTIGMSKLNMMWDDEIQSVQEDLLHRIQEPTMIIDEIDSDLDSV